MIAGSPLDLNLPSGVGGVADYLCAGAPGQCGGSYFPNALVFDFAEVWGSSVNEICATAAQEIAHSWTLDHATGASDPMTYKMPIQTPITYRDNAPCGSDCQYQCGANICNAFGVVCANAGGNNGWDGTHLCMETGTATQNEVAIIKGLFGPAGALPPTVALTTPTNGAAIQSGTAFPITATCTSNDGIQELDMSIDGVAKASLATSPAMFMGPATLADGTHHIAVLCGTKLQATATATADVIVGHACQTDTDCPDNHICYQHACIAGPMNGGGLGTGCTTNTDCASGDCANDGTQSLCVVPCDPAADMCPSGFGCRATDNGAGVCWLGDNAGSTCGGCDTRGNGAGTTLVSLTFGALWITRRKRR
jgi:hypothetical protein